MNILPQYNYGSFSSGIGGWLATHDAALISHNFGFAINPSPSNDYYSISSAKHIPPNLNDDLELSVYLQDVLSSIEEHLHRHSFLPTTLRFVESCLEVESNFRFCMLIAFCKEYSVQNKRFELLLPLRLNLNKQTIPEKIRYNIQALYVLRDIISTYHKSTEFVMEGTALFDMFHGYSKFLKKFEQYGISFRLLEKKFMNKAFDRYSALKRNYGHLENILLKIQRNILNYDDGYPPLKASFVLNRLCFDVPLLSLPNLNRVKVARKKMFEYEKYKHLGILDVDGKDDLIRAIQNMSVSTIPPLYQQSKDMKNRIKSILKWFDHATDNEIKNLLNSNIPNTLAQKIQISFEYPPLSDEYCDLQIWCDVFKENLIPSCESLVDIILQPILHHVRILKRGEKMNAVNKFWQVQKSSTLYLLERSDRIYLCIDKDIPESTTHNLFNALKLSIIKEQFLVSSNSKCPFENWHPNEHQECVLNGKSNDYNKECPSKLLPLHEIKLRWCNA